MRFMTDNGGHLFRSDGNVYEMLMLAKEWCADGEAYGVFIGMEDAREIDRATAIKLIKAKGVTNAEIFIDKTGLNTDETIKFLCNELGINKEKAKKLIS